MSLDDPHGKVIPLTPSREARGLLDPGHLEPGSTLKHPILDEEYILQQQLRKGGEGYTYLAHTPEGRKNVVKLRRTPSARDLEATLQEEYRRVNTLLGTTLSAFAHDSFTLVTLADYVEGENLEDELVQNNRVFTPAETVDFLLQLARSYLQPLHEHGLVHRDIKPANIICTTEGNERKFTLIDFGLLKEQQGSVTLTTSIRGTPGYTKFKDKYEPSDDLYSTARTAYFTLTGKHPRFVADEKYDKMEDEDVFNALPLHPNLKKILFKMLGHEPKNKYTGPHELIEDLQTAGSRLQGTLEQAINLTLARRLSNYREATTLPDSLRQKIEGLRQVFEAQYAPCQPSRAPLQQDFLSELDNALTALGYEKRLIKLESVLPKSKYPKNLTVEFYARLRRDSKKIDILKTPNGQERDRYFEYYTVTDIGKVVDLARQNERDKTRTGAYLTGGIISLLAPPVIGAWQGAEHFGGDWGGLVGFFLGLIPSVVVGVSRGKNKVFEEDELTIPRIYASTLLHLAGRLTDDLINGPGRALRYLKQNRDQPDKRLLRLALTPAPYFTYT